MPYCIAKYCTAAYENNPSNAHFHRLPKRFALRRQWLAKCGRPPGQDKQARVCSLHFTRDDYENLLQYESGFANKLILKPSAVPSVFGEPDVPVAEVAASVGTSERSRRLERRSTQQMMNAILRKPVSSCDSVACAEHQPSKNNPTSSEDEDDLLPPQTSGDMMTLHCSCCKYASVSVDASTQTDLGVILAAVSKDHPYSLTADTMNTSVRQRTSTTTAETDTLQPAALCDVPRSAQDFEDTDEMDIEEPLEQQSLSDPDYDPACDTDSTFSDCDEVEFASPDTVPLSPVQERKFIVFESCLTELFVRCPKPTCLSKVVSLQKSLSGSRLIVKTRCAAGCTSTWSSQPTLNKMGAGNLLLSAAVLFSGNTYTRLHDIADHLNMPIVGETQFYKIQKNYLFPVVNETWLSMQTAILDGLSTVDRIVMSGDGRCDSPGHCAKYMTYTLMDEEMGYITEFCVLSTADPTVKNSNAMEPMGLKKCLDSLKQFDINIAVLTTDRHVTIRKIMRLEYPTIIHQFDVWHLVKSITKRLEVINF